MGPYTDSPLKRAYDSPYDKHKIAYVRDPLASALPSSGVDFPVRKKEKNKPLKRVDSAWA